MKWNILKWMPFLAQQDLIHSLGRGPPGVELFVLSPKNVWYRRLKLLFTMTVKIDGQQNPANSRGKSGAITPRHPGILKVHKTT